MYLTTGARSEGFIVSRGASLIRGLIPPGLATAQ
jgi:hypothetical protein